MKSNDNMPFLLLVVSSICLVSRFRGSIIHAFPQMGVVLISKANQSNKIDLNMFQSFEVFPCFLVLYVYRFLETYLICLNDIIY